GLNAIGTEPELTLSLLPNAHAVLFILAADAGVSQSDIEVWRDHLVGGDLANRDARLVVLNKIDGLWDELKTGREIDAEIAQQARTTALTLGVPITQVFPVSAQKALLAKVHGEDSLLGRSRLPALEAALSQQLIPAKKDLVGSAIRAELRLITSSVVNLLRARLAGIH